MKYYKLLFILLISSLFPLQAQTPATEIRAVWLTTNWKLDWPANATSVQDQKRELQRILDELQELNFNTVFFQTRAQGKVFYNSQIEPRSPFFNHSNSFDPLAFAVEECHKRGLECHAWIVTYPDETIPNSRQKSKRKAAPKTTKPNYYKQVNGMWYLDPGRPEARQHIISIVREIVSNYDVDGVHFDYIRYPNNSRKFPDEDTYKKYGNGMDLYDWRRENINKLVFDIYDSVKETKRWVQVSSSPLGRYQILHHINANDGWTARETVFQDVGHWMKSGKHDLTFPMMYYRNNNFYPFLDDWMEICNDRIVVPGLGVYQMTRSEQDWSIGDITAQMDYTRQKGVQGQAYFRTRNVTDNLKGIKDSIKTFYAYPAKLPPLKWLDNEAPNSPVNLQAYKDENGMLRLEWESPNHMEDMTYNVYFSNSESIDRNNSATMLASGVRSNHYSFEINEGEFGFYYSVTASDRYHNESVPCFAAYYVHTSYEK
jgi:uncharacterized lipoprotein YddW (UPF0748 family)